MDDGTTEPTCGRVDDGSHRRDGYGESTKRVRTNDGPRWGGAGAVCRSGSGGRSRTGGLGICRRRKSVPQRPARQPRPGDRQAVFPATHRIRRIPQRRGEATTKSVEPDGGPSVADEARETGSHVTPALTTAASGSPGRPPHEESAEEWSNLRLAPGPQRVGPTYPVQMATSPRSAAFFDLDKTIIARSSTFAFSRPFYAGGLITRSAVLRSAYAHFVYLAGGADHDQMERLRAYLSDLVTGWDVQQVRDIVAETLEELIQPLVYREATALIAQHHAAGRDVVIVSSSGAEVVEPIGAMLGADHVVATRMVVEDGRYTGEILYYAYGENKAAAVRELADGRGYDLAECYAYSDSFTDLPMLAAVGHPVAVNPDRALRKEAVAREWPVLDFTQPVRLRTRVVEQVQRVPAPRPPMVAVALGASAATAGLIWYATRRRPAD